MKSFKVLGKESHVLVLIQEARPYDGEYGVGSWRLEHLEGKGEELDNGEDGDEGDEDGHLIIMMMVMKTVMMVTIMMMMMMMTMKMMKILMPDITQRFYRYQ